MRGLRPLMERLDVIQMTWGVTMQVCAHIKLAEAALGSAASMLQQKFFPDARLSQSNAELATVQRQLSQQAAELDMAQQQLSLQSTQ